MNNHQLLELLKTDVKGFNQYRKENPKQEIDFSDYGAHFYRLDLRNANLSNVFFGDRADFRFSDLRKAVFKGAFLEYADFLDADLSDADLRDANFSYSNFETNKTNDMKIREWQKDIFIESFLIKVEQ